MLAHASTTYREALYRVIALSNRGVTGKPVDVAFASFTFRRSVDRCFQEKER